ADSRAIDADQYVVDAVLGYGDFFQPQSGSGPGFHEGLHGTHDRGSRTKMQIIRSTRLATLSDAVAIEAQDIELGANPVARSQKQLWRESPPAPILLSCNLFLSCERTIRSPKPAESQ